MLARYLSDLLFRVSPTDTATFLTASVVLAVAALAACLLSVRRAVGLEPATALRNE